MPICDFALAFAARFCTSVTSGIASMSPRPKVGVGIRMEILLMLEKFSWLMLQPCGASERPAITKRPCTPPSGVPSEFLMKRASRTGPSAWTNEGIWFLELANATCGLVCGLLPPTAGWAWHEPHELELKRG